MLNLRLYQFCKQHVVQLRISKMTSNIDASRNVEIKAKITDLKGIIEKAKLLSKSDGTIIKQNDIFFNVNNGRLKLRQFEDNSSDLIFYNRPDQEGPKLSSYKKCEISSNETEGLKDVLKMALGTKENVKKVRTLFLVGQTRVHIDDVENLGHFMELEVVLTPGQAIEEGQTIAMQLMKELGVRNDDLLHGAYADMLK